MQHKRKNTEADTGFCHTNCMMMKRFVTIGIVLKKNDRTSLISPKTSRKQMVVLLRIWRFSKATVATWSISLKKQATIFFERDQFVWIWFTLKNPYQVWLLNNQIAYEKEFYFTNYSTVECSPSMCSSLLVTHRSICSSYWSEQCWKSSFVGVFRTAADLHFNLFHRLEPGAF